MSSQIQSAVANHNLVTVRMRPDANGRFGFNVKVWHIYVCVTDFCSRYVISVYA